MHAAHGVVHCEHGGMIGTEAEEVVDRSPPIKRRKIPALEEGEGLPKPPPITADMITDAYTAFVETVVDLHPEKFCIAAEGLREIILNDLNEVHDKNLGFEEQLSELDDVMAHLISFMPKGTREEVKNEMSEVFKTTIRLHEFGLTLFHQLLYDLLNGLDIGPVARLVSPGCGQFFEAGMLDTIFSPSMVIGQDTNPYSLTCALQHNQGVLSASMQLVDSADRPNPSDPPIDMGIFVHPNILDVDYWGSELEKMPYDNENFTPMEEIQAKFTSEAMNSRWKEVVHTVISRLRKGGHLVFLFYEHRERQLMRMFLEELSDVVKIEKECAGAGSTTFLYVEKPHEHPKLCKETYDWIVMKNYHTGLVARKL